MITSVNISDYMFTTFAVGRTYVSSSFENKLLLEPKVKLSLLILHPVAARSWYLEGVTALSRKRARLELIFPNNCRRSFPVEVQNSPKRSRSLRVEKPPVTFFTIMLGADKISHNGVTCFSLTVVILKHERCLALAC